MYARFARTLSQLRHEKGVSQREAAQALEVSQALLSHYENGIREPGLAFVVRACDYYQVSADYLLGRLTDRGTGQGASQGPAMARRLMTTTMARPHKARRFFFICRQPRSRRVWGGT